jgi:hypothetical protein
MATLIAFGMFFLSLGEGLTILTCPRLILYYPVSALVTLFANILQNPTDSRARSDLKLMNQVVTFLSALCSTDQNSSVKRMLNVCSEFERIAKVVLDKCEKEAHSRRKRKNQENSEQSNSKVARPAGTTPAAQSDNAKTPQPSQPGNIPNVFTPPDMSKYLTEEVRSDHGSCRSRMLTIV